MAGREQCRQCQEQPLVTATMPLAVERSNEACMPFFGAFGAACDYATVARGSANPLSLLGPELGARMAANVAVAQDPAGNLKPSKDKSTERIDGIVALIMAIGRAMVAQEEPEPEYSMFFV